MDLMPTLSAAWKARVKFLRCKRNCVTGVDRQSQEKGAWTTQVMGKDDAHLHSVLNKLHRPSELLPDTKGLASTLRPSAPFVTSYGTIPKHLLLLHYRKGLLLTY